MTKNIVEELPTRKHPVAAQKPEAGKEKPQDPEKKVKQAVYDIRYLSLIHISEPTRHA